MAEPLTYTCTHCGGTFVSTWTDEEAADEFARTFGGQPSASDAVVCDDCFRKLVGVAAG